MSINKSRQKLSDRYDSNRISSMSRGKANQGANVGYKLIVFGCILLVIIVISAALVIAIENGASAGNNGANAYNLVVTPEDIEEQLAKNPPKAQAGTYDVCMNSTWKFKNARSASENAYVENRITNTQMMNFTLILDETGESIYESPIVPVGSSLKNIKLDKEDLAAGTYVCTVVYHLLDNNGNEVSKVSFKVDVIIEE